MTTSDHTTRIVWHSKPELNHGRIGPGRWQSLCSCAWTGDERLSRDEAEQDATTHKTTKASHDE